MATSRATGRALARRLLEVSDLRKHYHARAGLLAALHGQTRSVPAVAGVSFALPHPEVTRRTAELLDQVNLQSGKLASFPHELSGGEKRRVGIARVLAVGARFIVADEPTSALDVSIQAQIVNLLRDLQVRLGLSYLFISHDLEVVELVSHRVAVMYLGKIVEIGPADRVARAARHPYTSILWSSLVEKRSDEVARNGAAAWGVFDFERPGQGWRFAPRRPGYQAARRPAIGTDPASE